MQPPRAPGFRVLTRDTIDPAVVAAQYAVRGAIPLRAEELRDELTFDDHEHPFDTVVSCNIGNPQQLDQRPLTFLRQVSSQTAAGPEAFGSGAGGHARELNLSTGYHGREREHPRRGSHLVMAVEGGWGAAVLDSPHFRERLTPSGFRTRPPPFRHSPRGGTELGMGSFGSLTGRSTRS